MGRSPQKKINLAEGTKNKQIIIGRENAESKKSSKVAESESASDFSENSRSSEEDNTHQPAFELQNDRAATQNSDKKFASMGKNSKKNETYVDFDIMKNREVEHEHDLKEKEEETEEVHEQSKWQMFKEKVMEFFNAKDKEELVDDEECCGENKVNNQKLSYFKSARLRKFEDEQNELQNLRSKFILKQSDPYREKWDYVVMTAAIYNCVYLPYEQAFEMSDQCDLGASALSTVNYSIDFLFFIDIILNFRTTYQNS